MILKDHKFLDPQVFRDKRPFIGHMLTYQEKSEFFMTVAMVEVFSSVPMPVCSDKT